MNDKKNEFPWETIDTTTLMMPEELIVYHIYRLKEEKSTKQKGNAKETASLLATYLNRESSKKEENQRCFQK